MRVRLSAAVLAMLGFPGVAFGLALGEIKLNSALNEPLDAEIEIQAAAADELENLSARIAPRETFERYGLDRPDFLTGLVFKVARAGGRDILQVRSRQPVAEPFVTFLVEAQWHRGRLLREYTVLLDPPVFMPVPESATRAPASAPVFTPRTAPAARPVERPAPRQASRPAPRRFAATPVSYSGDYGPIRRGETLWSIAERLRADSGFTMNQIMVAIYRANQGEFLGNINLMKEGSVLRIPDRTTIAALAQPEAFATAVAHNQAWRAGRPSQVAQVVPAPSAAAPAVPEVDRLRLVEPDLAQAGSGATGSGDDATTRAALARNEAELSRLATENDQLRSDLDEIRRLISLKDAEMAELQRQLSSAGEGAPAISPTPSAGIDDVTVAGAVEGATDATAPDAAAPSTEPPASAGDQGQAPDALTAGTGEDVAAPDTVATPDTAADTPAPSPMVSTSLPEQKSFFAVLIDSAKGLLGSLWLWIALGVLALAAFALVFLRNRGAGEPDALEALVTETDETAIVRRPAITTGGDSDDVEFFEDSGTFKPVDFAAAEGASETAEYPFEDTIGAGAGIKLDQSDPMAEADFHLAYGLYDQAADLVRKAVTREPDRVDLRMKLLEIFFVWGNQEEFRDTAQDLHDNMSGQIAGEWDKIVIMGKQICPDDELFAGGIGMASGADIDLEFDTTSSPSVDFDTTESPALTPADEGETGGLDLDIGDIGIAAAGGAAAAAGVADVLSDDDDDGLDFDLGLELPAADEDEDDTRPEPVDELKEQIKARLSSTDDEETAEMDLSDLGVDLDLGTTGEDTAGGFGEAFADEAAEPTSEMPAPTAELTAGAQGLDLDIGDMFGGLDSEDDDETARDLNSLEESMETTAPHQAGSGEDTGHFSAEIETLHGDALDVDISGFEEDEHGRTHLIDDNEPTGSHTEDAFSASVFSGPDDDIGETRMIGPDETVPSEDDPFSDVFGVQDDAETVLTEAPGAGHDGFETDIFGLQTGAQPVDLDIGETMEADGEDKTTVKVATADMALPGGDDELSEVGTKLDLARAYMDMGDPDGARGILEEVIAEGDESQQADARELLEALS